MWEALREKLQVAERKEAELTAKVCRRSLLRRFVPIARRFVLIARARRFVLIARRSGRCVSLTVVL